VSVEPLPIAVVLVAAMGENGVIGRANSIPWRLKSDLQHFRAITWGKPIVMGRKTFEAIKRPLPGRTTIVVSGDPRFQARGGVVAPNLDRALALARADARRRGVLTMAIIGGAQIYAQTLPFADEIALTLVHCRPDGDAMFPPLVPALWREVERLERSAGPGDDAPFTLIRLTRSSPGNAEGRRNGERDMTRVVTGEPVPYNPGQSGGARTA
jgi:dihydrofolate reductase